MTGLDDDDANALERAVRGLVVAVAVLGSIALVVWFLAGCGPRTPEQAEAVYVAEQSACVVDAHRKGLPIAAAHECREASDRRWGVPLRDGGR